MDTLTYVPITNYTVTNTTTNLITWSSIPSTYTDLRIVMNLIDPNYYSALRFNNDSSSNYSRTYMQGTGSAASGGSNTNQTEIGTGATNTGPEYFLSTFDIFSYADTSKYKTVIQRWASVQGAETAALVHMWRSTSAINTITFTDPASTYFGNGSTFALYGIKAA